MSQTFLTPSDAFVQVFFVERRVAPIAVRADPMFADTRTASRAPQASTDAESRAPYPVDVFADTAEHRAAES
jgi:hypothetical protein